MGVLRDWEVTFEEIDTVVTENPSLRGFLFGYLTEFMLKKMWFSGPEFSNVRKYDNHDRTHKGDTAFTYKSVDVFVEAKSLQTNSIKEIATGFSGKFQCDASDRRPVILPNGEKIETTCLVVGEFDLLAVGLFGFDNKWRFAFAKNEDLPKVAPRKYTEEQSNYLLKGTMDITWPLQPPFESEPFRLLDEIVSRKKSGVFKTPRVL